jgi:NADPH-dependent curcumin reductase CurA
VLTRLARGARIVIDGGVSAFPDALLKLFAGENVGKLVLAIEEA